MQNKKISNPNIMALMILGLSLFTLQFLVSSMISCYKYTNVCDKAVKAEAVVTEHDSYKDSDNDTHYRSYYEYTYEGKTYRDSYEKYSSESKLSPIGTVVQIEINPDKPDEIMSKLKEDSQPSVIWGTFFILSLVFSLKLLQISHLKNKRKIEVLDNETIEYYLKALVKCNFLRSCTFALSAFFLFLNLRFPLIFNSLPVAIALCAVYLGLSFFDAYRWNCIKNNAYTVYHGKFQYVTKGYDSDDGPVYYALFTFVEDYPAYRHRIDTSFYRTYPENSYAYPVLFNYQKKKKHNLVFIKNINYIYADWSIF